VWRRGAGEEETVFDPTSFALSDMVDCAAMLRREMAGADSFEDAANRAVTCLRRNFIDEATGRPSFVLARLFVTQRWEQLRPELQAHARKRLGGELERPDMRCLVLQASDGDQINWRKPSRSRSHRVIPLPSAEAVEKAPMLASLLRELGLSPNTVAGSVPVAHDMFPTMFGTFHVHNARGSKEVPSQRFVTKHGVRSVLGFGGLFNPASDYFGIPKSRADFGQTLHRWGVGAGPYFVPPFLPPATVRDFIGRLADSAINPIAWFLIDFWPEGLAIGMGEMLNERAVNYEAFQGVEETTLDLYTAVRDGYLRRRELQLRQEIE